MKYAYLAVIYLSFLSVDLVSHFPQKCTNGSADVLIYVCFNSDGNCGV